MHSSATCSGKACLPCACLRHGHLQGPALSVDLSLPRQTWSLLNTHAYRLGWGGEIATSFWDKKWVMTPLPQRPLVAPCRRVWDGGAMGHLEEGRAQAWPDPRITATLNQFREEKARALGWRGRLGLLGPPWCAWESGDTARGLCTVPMASGKPSVVSRDRKQPLAIGCSQG